ncbi:MAG TPA: 6-phosphofructokinase [Armatimonadota bacterium]|nr:6-phosphofructokinase [Armatimonadota bacterium]
MAKLRGNAIVGQSGGPTAVINQSLVGVIEAASTMPEITTMLGAQHGVQGILRENFIDLFHESKETLEAVADTPSAALGSVRKKPTQDECLQMFEIMKKNDVRYFFYIGGNDSAETAHIVNTMAKEARYELRCFHVPKTIDNDLRVTDHCPGYGSAAKFVSSAFLGDNLDNRALPGIKINVIMGRHAGFLTAASALAKTYDDDGPHLIYVPERPLTRRQFTDDVADVYNRYGRCIIAVSEGIIDSESEDGKTFTEVIMSEVQHIEKDTHGNVQLSGSGALGDWLANLLKNTLDSKLRVRADTFGYLQRSFPGCVSEIDALEARMCGRKAVEFATTKDIDGSVVLRRTAQESVYQVDIDYTELANVARETRVLPDEYINATGNGITPDFIDYARPLVGLLPTAGYFEGMRQ